MRRTAYNNDAESAADDDTEGCNKRQKYLYVDRHYYSLLDVRKKMEIFLSVFSRLWIMDRNDPQSSTTLWNYSKCGVYTVESEAGC
jgi:hypothetical protein